MPFEQQTWVITSYAVTFGAFLLFWGRVSDLYSAKPVFVYGFLTLGTVSLVISFLPDRYSFFVIRAISGIAGATLIPASFRLIVAVFEPHELGKAFTIYSSVGAIANSTGVIVAGFIEYIPNGESILRGCVVFDMILIPRWTDVTMEMVLPNCRYSYPTRRYRIPILDPKPTRRRRKRRQ